MADQSVLLRRHRRLRRRHHGRRRRRRHEGRVVSARPGPQFRRRNRPLQDVDRPAEVRQQRLHLDELD